SAPEGQPTIALVPLWNGDKLQGEREMDHLQALGKPQLAQIGPMTYTYMLASIDTQLAEVAGWHWETRTRSLPALAPGAVDAIVAAIARRTSPHSMVNWHHFHGAATRVPADAIAFGLRQEHFMVEIIASWEPDGSNGAAHRQWAHDLWESLTPFALPGGFANLLAPYDREQAIEVYCSNSATLSSLESTFHHMGVL